MLLNLKSCSFCFKSLILGKPGSNWFSSCNHWASPTTSSVFNLFKRFFKSCNSSLVNKDLIPPLFWKSWNILLLEYAFSTASCAFSGFLEVSDL